MIDQLSWLERVERAYRQEGSRMVRTLFAYAGSLEVAEDAVGEAFAQALRRGHDLRDVSAWVWRAAFAVANGDLARRRKFVHDRAVPDKAYEMSDDVLAIVEALRELSPKQRASVLLHHYADLPVRDVARVLGSSNAAVRVHLSAGRQRLRSLLETSDG